MRRPAKIAGSAAGNISLLSRVQRLACSSVNRSCMPRSADCSPNSVFTMIGNIEMITQTMTRDVWPVPNQNEISGTMARIGIAWSITMYGNTARSTSLVWLISTAMRDAEHDRDGQADEGHPGARPQPVEDLGEGVPVEEAVLHDLVRRLEQEAAAGASRT